MTGPFLLSFMWVEVDQGSDLSKKMRFKYSGNEGVFGIMLTGGVHYSSTEENAG